MYKAAVGAKEVKMKKEQEQIKRRKKGKYRRMYIVQGSDGRQIVNEVQGKAGEKKKDLKDSHDLGKSLMQFKFIKNTSRSEDLPLSRNV